MFSFNYSELGKPFFKILDAFPKLKNGFVAERTNFLKNKANLSFLGENEAFFKFYDKMDKFKCC